jgi:hypothetical protein
VHSNQQVHGTKAKLMHGHGDQKTLKTDHCLFHTGTGLSVGERYESSSRRPRLSDSSNAKNERQKDVERQQTQNRQRANIW